jgi:WD40 repeat protein
MRIIETGHPSVTALAFSPDGMTLATAGTDDGITLWELGGAESERLSGTAVGVQTLAFSPDGVMLASAGTAEMVVLWDLLIPWDLDMNRRRLYLAPKMSAGVPVCAVAWLHDSRLLAVGAGDRTNSTRAGHLLVWDLSKPGTPIKRVPEPHGVFAVVASPADKTVFWGGGRRISMQNLTSPDSFTFPPQTKEVRALALSPDGATLASADDWAVRLYDVARRQQRTTLTGHKGRVTTLAFSPDGRTLASAGWDQRVRFWDPDAGRERAAFDWGVGRIGAVAFSPDGLLAAAAGEGGKVVVWDVDEA